MIKYIKIVLATIPLSVSILIALFITAIAGISLGAFLTHWSAVAFGATFISSIGALSMWAMCKDCYEFMIKVWKGE